MKATERKPIIGYIAALGGWSVDFVAEVRSDGNYSTSTLTGYDRDFPYERFPSIPVVDFRTADGDKLSAAINILDRYRPKVIAPYYDGTIETYLDELRKIGIAIIDPDPCSGRICSECEIGGCEESS